MASLYFPADGTCLEANSAAGALVNLSRNDLIGSRLCDFCEKGFEQVWAELKLAESGRGQFWVQLKGWITEAGGLLLYGEHSSRPAFSHAA